MNDYFQNSVLCLGRMVVHFLNFIVQPQIPTPLPLLSPVKFLNFGLFLRFIPFFTPFRRFPNIFRPLCADNIRFI